MVAEYYWNHGGIDTCGEGHMWWLNTTGIMVE